MSKPQDATELSTPDDDSGLQTLDEVWRRYGEQLRRRARTRLRQYGLSGQAESMDICNDVMADLVRRASITNASINDIMSYILHAIDNQVLDTFRTLARHCRDFRRTDAKSIEDLPLSTSSPSPSQIAIRHEVLDRVRELLGPTDAKAVDMMLENRDWKEIGLSLGIEPDAARMRVRRAVDRVRAAIAVTDESSEPNPT